MGGGIGPLVNTFEQVSSDDNQMSVAGVTPGSDVQGVPYHVTFPMMHVMSPTPSSEQNDRQLPVKTLPSRNFIGGG